MTEHNTRAKLESRIIEKEWLVDLSLSNLDWLDSEELEAFFNTWLDLVRYYRSHSDDAEIGVEVLRSYLHYTRMFRQILLDDRVDPVKRNKAEECLIELEGFLEELIREVVSYLDSNKTNI